MVKKRLHKVGFAKRLCEALSGRTSPMQTADLFAAIGEKPQRNKYEILTRLWNLGIVERIGESRFSWRIKKQDWNQDNPFKTDATDNPQPKTEEVPMPADLSDLAISFNADHNEWEARGIAHKNTPFHHRDTLKRHGFTFSGEPRKVWKCPRVNPQLPNLKLGGARVEMIPGESPAPAQPTPQPTPKTAPIAAIPDLILEQLAEMRRELDEAKRARKVEITIRDPSKKKTVKLSERVHPIFEQVMFHINCGDNVMLIGPKGCGKTTLAGQVAKAMGLDYGVISLSGGVTESKLLGRNTPNITNGKQEFHSAPFAEFFEEGGLYLLDEIDGADPNVLLTLNTALAGGVLTLDRTKDPLVSQHANFHCMAAANTWGNGADRQYVGRNQLDGAVMDRFVTIPMDYDCEMELALGPDQDAIVRQMQAWRKRIVDNKLERVISTRLIVRAVNWAREGKDISYIQSMITGGWRADEIRKVMG